MAGTDRPSKRREMFDRFASAVSERAGHAASFAAAVAILVVWVATGPILGFSNSWQLIINTGTTIVTFLMVFLIQHSEAKNSRAVQMKLDELIAATEKASNQLIDVEDLSDDELSRLHERFADLAERRR